MEQEQIYRYCDNLDVNAQCDLLKKVLNLLMRMPGLDRELYPDIAFIEKQIEEFNEQYVIKTEEL